MAIPEANSSTTFYTREEVAKHTNSDNLWFIIHNNVYDITGFLKEHPGGEEVLYEQAGLDATEAFENVGHSSDARQMMEPYKIGELVEEERNISSKDDKKRDWGSGDGDDDGSSRCCMVM
ncbi:cytochrome b5-like isoform X2 [Chelonus insularis]|uniref:cytochrome b5-like isoform X2 n=1 Tax=Chelonus insularis TaxID=460826 RepID=UPI00158CB22C|nr:cytochrome b5-like isoform X2 [Chelonus insularis]